MIHSTIPSILHTIHRITLCRARTVFMDITTTAIVGLDTLAVQSMSTTPPVMPVVIFLTTRGLTEVTLSCRQKTHARLLKQRGTDALSPAEEQGRLIQRSTTIRHGVRAPMEIRPQQLRAHIGMMRMVDQTQDQRQPTAAAGARATHPGQAGITITIQEAIRAQCSIQVVRAAAGHLLPAGEAGAVLVP